MASRNSGPGSGRAVVAVIGAGIGAVLALAGCSGAPAAAPPSSAAAVPQGGGGAASTSSSGSSQPIPVGPGPQSPYRVQPQPAPGTCHYRQEGSYPLPDPACTPGATNPKVTQDALATTICRTGGGYTSSIRPPASITGREKAANAKSYGYTGSFATGEYDHLISLELGGDPNDPRNLWVEPNDRPNATTTTNGKDAVENAAHTAICTGRLTLAQAQQGIATDWPALGRSLGISLP